MSARYRRPEQEEEPRVIELDGPATAYFEIPLSFFATPNGELEAENHPDAARLCERVTYVNFLVADTVRVMNVIDRVKGRLKEIGGGYLWWRRRPIAQQDGKIWFRLATTPQLPDDWWRAVSKDVGNGDLGKNVPGLV